MIQFRENARPIEPAFTFIPGNCDHDRAGLSLPVRVMERQAKHPLRPVHGFGVQRFTDTARCRSDDSVNFFTISSPAFIRSGCGSAEYQTVTLFFSINRYQFSAQTDILHALCDTHRERRDDAVRCAGHPARSAVHQ